MSKVQDGKEKVEIGCLPAMWQLASRGFGLVKKKGGVDIDAYY